MAMTITQSFSAVNDIRKAMAALTEQDVLVGIPEDKAAREADGDSGISNAYLGYIHEFGVPEKNIPARPFLIPGIEKVQPEIAAALKSAAQKALAGNEGAVQSALNKIGLLAQGSVRAAFVDNDWPELSEKTLDRRIGTKSELYEKARDILNKKAKRKKMSGDEYDARYDRLEAGVQEQRGRVNPLIDSNQLRKSITYVIRKS